jgi:cytochrome c oxidase cbb3-type subunit IV
MDINLLRGVITALALIAFLAIVWWAYGSSRRSHFERLARIPLEDDGGGR